MEHNTQHILDGIKGIVCDQLGDSKTIKAIQKAMAINTLISSIDDAFEPVTSPSILDNDIVLVLSQEYGSFQDCGVMKLLPGKEHVVCFTIINPQLFPKVKTIFLNDPQFISEYIRQVKQVKFSEDSIYEEIYGRIINKETFQKDYPTIQLNNEET